MVKNKIALVRVHIHNLYLLRYTWVEKYIQEINSLSMFGFYRGEDFHLLFKIVQTKKYWSVMRKKHFAGDTVDL